MKIRNRLALFLSLSAAGVLLLVSLLIYFTSAAHRQQDFFYELKEEAARMVQQLEEEPLQEPVTGVGLRKRTSLILPLRNPQKAADSLKALFPADFVEKLFLEGYAEFQANGQEGVGQLFEKEEGGALVIIAANDRHGKAQLENLRKLLLAGFLLSVPLLYFFGRLSARHILKPIAAKIQEARRIGAANLPLRLKVCNEQDETGQLAITFNELLDRLEASFEMQRNFISNASHEIRNPLSVILGEAEVCLEKRRTPEEYIESLQSISTEAERLNALVSNLLNLAKADFGEAEVLQEEVRLDEILLEARLNAAKSYPGSRITIDFSALPEDPDWLTIQGSPNLLRVAFSNLMENACKFSANQEVLVTLTASEKELRLRVIDKGVGIPPQEIKNIFQPFYRARNARSFKGFGIGLSLTDKIIRLHQGQITILSEEEKGTTMEVGFLRTFQKF